MKKSTDSDSKRVAGSNHRLVRLGYGICKPSIRRPKHTKDKSVTPGMKLFVTDDGMIEARRRAPSGGGKMVGTVLSHAVTDSAETVQIRGREFDICVDD